MNLLKFLRQPNVQNATLLTIIFITTMELRDPSLNAKSATRLSTMKDVLQKLNITAPIVTMPFINGKKETKSLSISVTTTHALNTSKNSIS
jgi:hypothetical protein